MGRNAPPPDHGRLLWPVKGGIQLTVNFGNNHHPTWSPGGDKIVFSHGSLGQKAQQIYTINADGTGLTRTTKTNDNSFTPDWGSG